MVVCVSFVELWHVSKHEERLHSSLAWPVSLLAPGTQRMLRPHVTGLFGPLPCIPCAWGQPFLDSMVGL